jgi:hypothetical protein
VGASAARQQRQLLAGVQAHPSGEVHPVKSDGTWGDKQDMVDDLKSIAQDPLGAGHASAHAGSPGAVQGRSHRCRAHVAAPGPRPQPALKAETCVFRSSDQQPQRGNARLPASSTFDMQAQRAFAPSYGWGQAKPSAPGSASMPHNPHTRKRTHTHTHTHTHTRAHAHTHTRARACTHQRVPLAAPAGSAPPAGMPGRW